MTAIAMTINPTDVPARRTVARVLFDASVFVFVLSTLFDPADRVLGLKVPLYILCWATGVMLCLSEPGRIRLPATLVMYIGLMIGIPLVSIWNYYLLDASVPFEGFVMLKAYLFISMAALLYVTRTNLMKLLSMGLLMVGIAVIIAATAVIMTPDLYIPMFLLGKATGIFTVDTRDYGGLKMFQMYFVVSPMLAMAGAFFFERAFRAPRRRGWWALAAIVTLVSMDIAGTRNNLAASILLPAAMFLMYSRRKVLTACVIGAGLIFGTFMVLDQLAILLSPDEASNSVKLAMARDYLTVFSSWNNLLFGRGLGAYDYWTGRGPFYITELTYLEVLRNFGVIFGLMLLLLLAYPIVYAFVIRPSYPERNIVVGYGLYLVMCASNPNLFSSMGMLILSILVANISMYEARLWSMSTAPPALRAAGPSS